MPNALFNAASSLLLTSRWSGLRTQVRGESDEVGAQTLLFLRRIPRDPRELEAPPRILRGRDLCDGRRESGARGNGCCDHDCLGSAARGYSSDLPAPCDRSSQSSKCRVPGTEAYDRNGEWSAAMCKPAAGAHGDALSDRSKGPFGGLAQGSVREFYCRRLAVFARGSEHGAAGGSRPTLSLTRSTMRNFKESGCLRAFRPPATQAHGTQDGAVPAFC